MIGGCAMCSDQTQFICLVPPELGCVAERDVVHVEQYLVLALPVPDLVAGVARVGEDRADRVFGLPQALEAAPADGDGPAIVCVQAGNVATGAFDPFGAIADLCRDHGAWLHVDGAFGLWAAAVLGLQHLTADLARANSWAVDAHKWLNVPYDVAMAIVDDPAAHVGSMSLKGPYLVASAEQRDSSSYVPESSRRARAVPVYAALRSLGREGVIAIVERNCEQARRMAERLTRDVDGAQVLNDVVLNQVLVRFPGGDDANRAIIAEVQRDGTCWLGGTQWQGEHVMRGVAQGDRVDVLREDKPGHEPAGWHGPRAAGQSSGIDRDVH
jgi:glutamate/tyrosine decarboxylase-like PLP-dependent enzyme